MPNFAEFEKKLPGRFNQPALLQQAFTHRSYLNENQLTDEHNERLEFLGDAVLELVVTEFLFAKYPEDHEGDLTAYRAALVNAETLAQVAGQAGMNNYLLLSKGEARDTGRARQTILANTFESVVGAIFLDQGYEPAKQFITEYLLTEAESIINHQLWQDAKSLFQEQAQAKRGITPTYEVLSEAGPDHNKLFTVGLYLGAELAAEGRGSSKQRAEQDAARRGLDHFGWSTN